MAFLGMRGTGDWATDQRPMNWRQQLLRHYPNGDMPLTAITSKMSSESVDDPQFHWWTKSLATQRATVTGTYTNTALSTAYVSGGVAGDTVFIKMSSDDISQWRIGHQILMRYASDLTVDCVGVVTGRSVNGSSSYLQVELLEADNNSNSYDLSDCDVALIIGNVNAEGAGMPDAISYNPTKWYNYTQIWRTPLEETRTAMKTRLRVEGNYKELKREALELHGIEMEKSFMYGVPSERTGANGKPERTTLGIIPAIRGGYTGQGGTAGTVDNFVTNTDYTADTWLSSGETWLDEKLETIFRRGSQEKLALVGSGTILAINKLIKNGGNFDFTPATEDYGIKVTKWTTPFGVINMMRHPLLSYETTTNNAMVIFEPKDIKFRYIDDTFFKDDKTMKSGSYTNRDGIKEEWLTEGGMEYNNIDGWGYLTGFGTDNSL